MRPRSVAVVMPGVAPLDAIVGRAASVVKTCSPVVVLPPNGSPLWAKRRTRYSVPASSGPDSTLTGTGSTPWPILMLLAAGALFQSGSGSDTGSLVYPQRAVVEPPGSAVPRFG